MNQEIEKTDIPLLRRGVIFANKYVWEISGYGFFALGLVLAIFSIYRHYFFGLDPEKFNAESFGRIRLFASIQYSILLMGIGALVRIIHRINRKQEWIYRSTLWTIDRLKVHGLHCVLNDPGRERTVDPERWPWGGHHTQQLGHLEAAANKWWKLYDPSDITTAPTNEMVAEWLMQERGVAKDKARAIASILRADGLPAGRR